MLARCVCHKPYKYFSSSEAIRAKELFKGQQGHEKN